MAEKIKASVMMAVLLKNPTSAKARKFASRLAEGGYPKALTLSYGKDKTPIVFSQTEQQALILVAKNIQKQTASTPDTEDEIDID